MHTVKLPSVQYDPAIDNQIVNMQEMKPLKVYNVPVSTTFAIFDDSDILTDPTHEEESLCSGIITIVVKDSELCSVLKPGGSTVAEEDLLMCIAKGIERGSLVSKLVNNAVQESNDED
ncbi:3prime exoribonuclease family, domain 2 [Popillia japonica]|uniref:3prime exoribonuclease family, domain 2 n=1 Tax=Popillia japonica TaxID=7064 RepID=A0AAW1IT90_POPJA